MKKIGDTPTSAIPTALDERAVAGYLACHPNFFIHNAWLAHRLTVPHPVRGSVSLVEWYMARARSRIDVLEESIQALMAQAVANESLFRQLLELQRRLMQATSLQDMLERLHRWARELGLAGATVRLFSDRWRIGAPSSFTHLALSQQAFEPLRIQRFGDHYHYLGPLNAPELLVVLPQAKAINSVAISLLGSRGDLGLLIFSSRDAHHYEAGQGTQLLDELAKMLPELLERWVERI